jgi:hypothetical protein
MKRASVSLAIQDTLESSKPLWRPQHPIDLSDGVQGTLKSSKPMESSPRFKSTLRSNAKDYQSVPLAQPGLFCRFLYEV